MRMTSVNKKSGIKCVENIPIEWKNTKIKYVSELDPIKSELQYNNFYGKEVTFLPMEKLKSGFLILDSERIFEEVFEGYNYFADGDILFAKVTPSFENGNIGIASNLVNGLGFGSSEIYVLRANKIDKLFLYYFIQNDEFKSESVSNMYGVAGLKRVPSGFIRNYEFALPTFQEQRAIADFLDKKTAQIDKAHDLLTRQIETLKNYRKSLIYEAVTKGLDTKVKLKPSGVDWIGDVPCGWEVSKLKYLTVGKLQYGANAEGVDFSENLPRYIRITDISQDNNLKIDGKQSLPLEISAPYILNDGDILFARSGATVGKTFLYTEECGKAAFAGYLIRANFDKNKVISKFIYYTTLGQGYENWKNSIFSQSTIQNIGADKYSELWIAIPNYMEQQGITSFLDKKTSKVDEIIQNKQQQIQNLDKQRKTLIYDYVTGKKRVK
ncbi:hypothetical protein RyT2_10510 [Pseudolactococcus yaeyamensis]